MYRNSDHSITGRISHALSTRKLLFASVFLFVVVSGMVTTLLITPKYEATMSIFVSRDRIDPQINPSDRNPEITSTDISDEEFNSELEIIKSVDAIRAVVTELSLMNDRKPNDNSSLGRLRTQIKWSVRQFVRKLQGSVAGDDVSSDSDGPFSVESTVNLVMANLDVVPTKKSRIIKVTYTDTDPMRAKRTLEKVYEKYVELHVKINGRPEAEQVFNEQTDHYGQKLNATTDQLKQFDSQNGIAGAEIATQRELLLKQLYDTQAQVNATRTEIGETEQRVAALRAKVDAMPEQIEVGSVSKYVGALDAMKSEQVKLEQQRTELLQKYKPNSRFVRENEDRLRQLRQNIASETANPPQERSYAINELRRRLETDLNIAQTSLTGLKKKELTLSSQAATLSAQAAELNGKSIERAEIERKRAINEEAYLLYQKKGRENQITQVLNKEQVMNFSVVDQPRTDGEQKTPKPLLNLTVLILVGLFAGFAAAIVSSGRPERSSDEVLMLTGADFAKRYGLPVLASVPMIEADEPLKLNP